jgi:hypothetical protein
MRAWRRLFRCQLLADPTAVPREDGLHDFEDHYGQSATLPTAQRIAKTLAMRPSSINSASA